MQDERIIKEMARLDRYTKFKKEKKFQYGMAWGERNGGYICFSDLPHYLNDHNACQRVIDNLDETDIQAYWDELCGVTGANEPDWQITDALKATPRQKCEAILKIIDSAGPESIGGK